ncbi:hypothetical protein SLEP1_g35979 [Rubroshorea leprosula]|uniref:F-box domain-containing protein n=1 Tax=Rubroshorea leprosula TaxID=152421 RepID=A0AAV5KPZ4_9ROSI|nr:hypothetical protein SLEP1_g35979 [Rubroshorea leprosula]
MTDNKDKDNDTLTLGDNSFGKLPDHLLIEIFIRVPVSEWGQVSCVRKQWANLFRGECLWQAALTRTFPLVSQVKRWPGPIPRGHSLFGHLGSMPSLFPPKHGKVSLVGTFDATYFRRRFAALYVSKRFFELDEEIDEIIGHTFLFLKEQLEHSTMPLSSGVLHGTIIGVASILFIFLFAHKL